MSLFGAVADHYVASSSPAVYQSSAASTAAAGSTTVTVNKPSGASVGDVLIALVSSGSSSSTFTTPAGWVLATSGSGMAVFRRIVDGTEGSTFTFTRATSTTGVFVANIARISGADNTRPIQTSGQATQEPGGFGPSITLPQITPTNANTLLFQIINVHDSSVGQSSTPPGTTTKRYEITTATTARYAIGGDEVVGPGITSTKVWTWSASNTQWRGAVLAINPA